MAQRSVWKCDECGKEETVHESGYSPPPAPWANVTVGGFYYDKYNERLGKLSGHVCGAECLKARLTKALIAVEEIEAWEAAGGNRDRRRG